MCGGAVPAGVRAIWVAAGRRSVRGRAGRCGNAVSAGVRPDALVDAVGSVRCGYGVGVGVGMEVDVGRRLDAGLRLVGVRLDARVRSSQRAARRASAGWCGHGVGTGVSVDVSVRWRRSRRRRGGQRACTRTRRPGVGVRLDVDAGLRVDVGVWEPWACGSVRAWCGCRRGRRQQHAGRRGRTAHARRRGCRTRPDGQII